MGRLPHLGPGTAPSPLRAVLFDMDGTLVETEQLWGEAMFELAARLGGRMSDAARQQTVGTSMRTSMQVLHADLGIRRTEAELRADAAWVEGRTAELMAGGIAWRPGASELLRSVRAAGLATALVTTTPRAAGRHRARVDPSRAWAPIPSMSPSAGTRSRPASRIRLPTCRRWPPWESSRRSAS